MKIEFELPNDFIRVTETADDKGSPVTVAAILGLPVMYLREDVDFTDIEQWEYVLSLQLANYFANYLVEQVPEYWTRKCPTGREVHVSSMIKLIREDFDS